MTHYLKLNEELIAKKAAALAAHRSQYPSPPVQAVRWTAQQVGAAVGESLAEVSTKHEPLLACFFC